ncbi:hypothetical protein [Propionivibrio sp.]|uniref:hypothetical protein n=1 Tax=Propionivibrio sp. TaxID=2212460 RepID=UPI002619BCB1|nr:hypothetical protein [Propionivibrio sp.]
MNKFNIKLAALAIGFAFSAGAMAQTMTKTEYKDSKTKISTEYKAAGKDCAALSGNANDICVAEAKGKENVAKAELEAGYKPSTKNHYNVLVAKAEADYEVAIQKCDDLSGNVKDVCVKEAKAAQTTAKADAKAQKTTAGANATATEKTAEARSDANIKVSEARKDAKVEKGEAQYTVAKEKCDAFSGASKDDCLNKAKMSAGK